MKKFLLIFLFPLSLFADDGQCHVRQVGLNGYQIVCEGDGINYGYETITNHVLIAENCEEFKQQLENYAENELSAISFACGNGSGINSDSISCVLNQPLQNNLFFLYDDLKYNMDQGASWPGDSYLRVSDYIGYHGNGVYGTGDYQVLTNLFKNLENNYESNYRQLKSTYNTITNLQCSTCDNSGGSSGGSGGSVGGECCTDYSQQFSTIITRLSQIKEGIYNAETNLVSIEEAIFEKLYNLVDVGLANYFDIYTNEVSKTFWSSNNLSAIGLPQIWWKQGPTSSSSFQIADSEYWNNINSLLRNCYDISERLSSLNNYMYFNFYPSKLIQGSFKSKINTWSTSLDSYVATTNINILTLQGYNSFDHLGMRISKYIYNTQNLQLNINESLVRIAKSVANGPDSQEEQQQFEHDLEEADYEGNQQQLIDSFDQQTAQQLTTDSFLSSQTINSAFQNTLPQFGESLPSVVTIAIPRWGDGSAQDSLVFTINIQDYHWFFNLIRATVRFFYYGLFAFFIYWLFKWFLIFLKWIWGLLQSTHIG